MIIVAIVAILIADYLSLANSFSAAIVAILSIGYTKKQTILDALQRVIAFIIALFIAYISFMIWGYTTYAYFIFLIQYILVCQIFNWQLSIAINSVLISHFIGFQVMNSNTIYNEVLLFLIGLSCGIIANLHLRKKEAISFQVHGKTDSRIQELLTLIAMELCNQNATFNHKKCFDDLQIYINDAKVVMHENYMNQFFSKKNTDLEYIIMREKQLLVLKSMYDKAVTIDKLYPSSSKVSKYLEVMANTFNKDNDTHILSMQLTNIYEEMQELSLPSSRNEFEVRATILSIIKDIEEILIIKKQYIKNSNRI